MLICDAQLGGHYVAYTALPPSRPHPESESASNTKSDAARSNASIHTYSSDKQTRRWAYVSDTVVRLTTLEEVLKAKAYICMYEKV